MDFADRVDPDLHQALSLMQPHHKGHDDVVFEMRRFAEEMGGLMPANPLGARYEDRVIPGMPGEPDVTVRIYRPENALPTLPALLWIHGGGYFVGDLNGDDAWLTLLMRNVGCVIISVEYRLAPEHPFPAAINDCYAALAWLHANAAELGVDAARIAIGGESAGGGLSSGLALMARDRGEYPICFQLLLCPPLDDRCSGSAHAAITDLRVPNGDFTKVIWKHYLGNAYGTDTVSEYAAAARASDLTRLPPAFIAVGELDQFVDECIDYAQRLTNAYVPTELVVYPRAFHGFERFSPDARVSRKYTADRDAALKRAFYG